MFKVYQQLLIYLLLEGSPAKVVASSSPCFFTSICQNTIDNYLVLVSLSKHYILNDDMS